jgi:hypothetical protein
LTLFRTVSIIQLGLNSLTQHQQPSEQALENAVSRALRDNLIPLQRTADELQQAYSDLVAACSSSRSSNALPAMLRAQAAASSLAAGLSVLSNFLAVAFNPNYQQGWDVHPAPSPIAVAFACAAEIAETEAPAAAPVPQSYVESADVRDEVPIEVPYESHAEAPVEAPAEVRDEVREEARDVVREDVHAEEIPDVYPAASPELHAELHGEIPAELHAEAPVEVAPEATVMHAPDVSPELDSPAQQPQEQPVLDSTPILAAEEIVYDAAPPPPSPDLRIPESPFPSGSVEEAIEASLQFSSAAPSPPASPESPAFDISTLPPDLQDLHRRANRVAKVAMQDIKLLRPKDVRLGRENKDICQRLRSDLDKARKEYDRRCHAILDHPVDYFHRWMVEILAEGDEESLGEYPYPSPVLRH